jgi:hypothetical protein
MFFSTHERSPVAQTRKKSTWQYIAVELDKAAAGADPIGMSVALQMALMLEGVE